MKRRMETNWGGCKHTETVCQEPGLTPPSLQSMPANQRATITGLTRTRPVAREKKPWVCVCVCAFWWKDLNYPDGVFQAYTHRTELNTNQQCLFMRHRSRLFGIWSSYTEQNQVTKHSCTLWSSGSVHILSVPPQGFTSFPCWRRQQGFSNHRKEQTLLWTLNLFALKMFMGLLIEFLF